MQVKPQGLAIRRARSKDKAAGVRLSAVEVAAIDAALDGMETSAVFGGSRIKRKE